MSFAYNTSIVRDGLVFHTEMSNTAKSYVGKPTNNLIATTPSGACRIGLANAGEYLTGSIGDFKLFNRTLSASEVNSLYQTNRDRYGV